MEDDVEKDEDSEMEYSQPQEPLDSQIDPVLKDLYIKLSKSLSYLKVQKHDSSLISGKMLLIIYHFLENWQIWPKSSTTTNSKVAITLIISKR